MGAYTLSIVTSKQYIVYSTQVSINLQEEQRKSNLIARIDFNSQIK